MLHFQLGNRSRAAYTRFQKRSFGFRVATITDWLFAFWFITGAPAVTLIAASYLGYAFPLSRPETLIAAAAILFLGFLVNYRGIVVSSKVQLAVIVSIVALIVVATISSVHLVKAQNFAPFLPSGFVAVGTASALIFWSYLGYENVSNIAEEFKNPKKDFLRSIMLSVVLISILYVSVSFVTVGTLAYKLVVASLHLQPSSQMSSGYTGLRRPRYLPPSSSLGRPMRT